ncbi:hypothetical protein Sta7437_1241 [Stanieria cyanosphaera PCC 7437]|uniref:DUF4278 domain-containing protein n=1 Tax=Stanieria cyanosphaera (strain ATCC 29371 / PCC 7437) TaxID=111780 RepID=K9XRX9_STAC7|nr:DUF4278 domain-containing protein [Stanieria cyanosphaera]AFZ34811.1 hypothetical protein Sta7437_1241 [Stanieria cyanosphaera PCC 7437]
MQLTYRGINYQSVAGQKSNNLQYKSSVHYFVYRGVSYSKCLLINPSNSHSS